MAWAVFPRRYGRNSVNLAYENSYLGTKLCHIVNSITCWPASALSHPSNLATLRRELDSKLTSSPSLPHVKQAGPAEETAFDRLESAGLIGCLIGMPGTPTDLSTNPKHMEGFGHG